MEGQESIEKDLLIYEHIKQVLVLYITGVMGAPRLDTKCFQISHLSELERSLQDWDPRAERDLYATASSVMSIRIFRATTKEEF